MSSVIITLIVVLYNFALIAGTAYLVVNYNWSMWTFFLTLLLLIGIKRDEENKNEGY